MKKWPQREATKHWGHLVRQSNKITLNPGPILDLIYSIPLGGSIRIAGPPQSGMTAIALEICRSYIESGGNVYYFDLAKSLFEHRILDLKKDFLFLPVAHCRADILKTAKVIGIEPCLIVLDRSKIIKEDWQVSDPTKIIKMELRLLCPNSTLVFADTGYKDSSVGTGWDEVIKLSDYEARWLDGNRLGHEILATGNKGKQTLFISHKTGRIHWSYISAREQEIAGTPRQGNFQMPNGTFIKGFWNFVDQNVLRD